MGTSGRGWATGMACVMVATAAAVATQPAVALPTTNCTPQYKGTAGNDTIHVSVGPGQTVVVCTGAGTDEVIVEGIVVPSDLNSRLWIAFGQGTKTVTWNAGNVKFNDFDVQNPPAASNQAIIVRPEANPKVSIEGVNAHPEGVEWACGTNAEFQVDPSGWELKDNGGSAYLNSGGPFNLDC